MASSSNDDSSLCRCEPSRVFLRTAYPRPKQVTFPTEYLTFVVVISRPQFSIYVLRGKASLRRVKTRLRALKPQTRRDLYYDILPLRVSRLSPASVFLDVSSKRCRLYSDGILLPWKWAQTSKGTLSLFIIPDGSTRLRLQTLDQPLMCPSSSRIFLI